MFPPFSADQQRRCGVRPQPGARETENQGCEGDGRDGVGVLSHTPSAHTITSHMALCRPRLSFSALCSLRGLSLLQSLLSHSLLPCPLSCWQDAIRTKKAEQQAEREALDAIMAQGLGEGVHPLERPEVPAHIKVCAPVWVNHACQGAAAPGKIWRTYQSCLTS